MGDVIKELDENGYLNEGSFLTYDDTNTSSLEKLKRLNAEDINRNVIVVALNPSNNERNSYYKEGEKCWNFHSDDQGAKKLRDTTKDTCAENAFIIDVEPGIQNPNSNEVKVSEESVKKLQNVIDIIQGDNNEKPVLIAEGGKAAKALKNQFGDDYEIVQVRHYSDFGHLTTREHIKETRNTLNKLAKKHGWAKAKSDSLTATKNEKQVSSKKSEINSSTNPNSTSSKKKNSSLTKRKK